MFQRDSMQLKDLKKVVLLAGEGTTTNIVFNALNKEFNVVTAIVEQKEKTSVFLKRRIRKLGYVNVAGQILFQLIAVPVLQLFSNSQHNSVLRSGELSSSCIPGIQKTEVISINNSLVTELITKINPDVVVVNGTRIISKNILSKINCPVINMHAGITPLYRGVHGGYWALVNNDRANCGVTVHLVDAGVDTGEVIDQAEIEIDDQDNFLTYPMKQLQAGIPLLITSVQHAIDGTIRTRPTTGLSKQWFHPTLWQYCYYRIFKGVK